MNQPMIIWCAIVVVLLLAFIFRSIARFYTEGGNNELKPRRLIEFGKEMEMFYLPGDVADDDFED